MKKLIATAIAAAALAATAPLALAQAASTYGPTQSYGVAWMGGYVLILLGVVGSFVAWVVRLKRN